MSACSVTRHERTREQIEARREVYVQELLKQRVAFSHQVLRRWEREIELPAEEHTFDMLILSGGGDYGAFGAGVLEGWGRVTDGQYKRPVFDVVTGVSTGALIAPLAFVGTPEAYKRSFEVYQNPKPEWLKPRGTLTFLLTKRSYMDNTGLAQEIRKTLDDSILQGIAQGNAEDRVLMIGTSNLDMGMLAMWELGPIASRMDTDPHARELLYKVVLASASIPGAFPPVEIEGDLHADGGVMRNIAYTTDQDYPESAVSLWMDEYADRKPLKARIWVIINNQLGTTAKSLQPGWPSLMKRSLELSIKSSTLSSLKALATTMQLQREMHGFDVEFRFIAIPDEWTPPVPGDFKKETMTDLARLGATMGADPANWRVAVPNPESPTSADMPLGTNK